MFQAVVLIMLSLTFSVSALAQSILVVSSEPEFQNLETALIQKLEKTFDVDRLNPPERMGPEFFEAFEDNFAHSSKDAVILMGPDTGHLAPGIKKRTASKVIFVASSGPMAELGFGEGMGRSDSDLLLAPFTNSRNQEHIRFVTNEISTYLLRHFPKNGCAHNFSKLLGKASE